MTQPDMKPCPMCGGKAHLYKVDYHGYKVVCVQCLIQTGKYEHPDNAVARWNRRFNEREQT